MMKAGKYYVGDLCYVMSDEEWDQFCSITIKGIQCLDGEFELPDGRKFATYSTAYGDGVYKDQFGNRYSVDAGLIGCIRVDDIKDMPFDNLGAIHDFEHDFTTSGDREYGKIMIGHIVIDTK